MQFHEILEDSLVVEVSLLLLFDLFHGGRCSRPTFIAVMGLVVVYLHFGLDLLVEIAIHPSSDRVELLLADCFDSGGLGLGAHAQIIGIVTAVLTDLDKGEDFELLLGLSIFALVFLFCKLGLKQPLLYS
jgi:hypothetical protein